MALSLQQVQKQSQRLIMTPQMQQSIQLLQMNTMDMEQLIRTEMESNPFLELGDDEEALHSEIEAIEPEEYEREKPDEFESGLSEQATSEIEIPDDYDGPSDADIERKLKEQDNPDPDQVGEFSEQFENTDEPDFEWSDEFLQTDRTSYTSTHEDQEDHDIYSFTRIQENLHDNLMRQLHLSSLGGRDFEIGEFIIGNLNDDGYLDSDYTTQALMMGFPVEIVSPEMAGSGEKVDKRLREILAKFHNEANPDAFTSMKRKELIGRIIAAWTKVSYDEVLKYRGNDRLLLLIAKALNKSIEEVKETRQEDLLLDCIAHRMETQSQRVFDVLEVLQEFEPTGICARSLGECLRLQCEEMGIRNRLLYQILDDHLNDLQQKRFRELSKALDVSESEVREVFHILARLDPKPARSISVDKPRYITPDVYVKKIEGQYLYFLNEGDASRLKIAANYRRLMSRKKDNRQTASQLADNGSKGKAELTSIDPEYAHEKYKNAIWLIKNIEKRKSTILRVTEAIMDYQKEFLEKGIEHLRPLTLKDIAVVVGMHESTIARVTTKKYVETPRGIFELKYFFSSGLETEEGTTASSRSIKEIITQLIEGEDRRRPLSDQKIADILKKKGFQIARRTVAKYREQLKILPAKLRKDVKQA